MNSGGIDSRITAAMLHAQGWTIHSIYNDWTQLEGQAKAAEKTADLYCVQHEVFHWPMPDWIEPYNEQLKKRCLPHTTFHTAMLGAIRAVTLGIYWIASGARIESATDDFKNTFQTLLNASKFYPDKLLILPLWDLKEIEITQLAAEYNVDLNSTWSCPNSDPHCGKCESCNRRIRQEILL